MAKVIFNPLIEEVSGQFGDVVFREVRGKTVLARKPRGGYELTDGQAAHRDRFLDAVAYGKTVMADSNIRELYEEVAEQKETPLFALTVADFLNPPSIKQVDLGAYNGQINDVIKIKAADDFGVAQVHVSISDASNNYVLESGEAIETATGSGLWLYSVTVKAPVDLVVNINVVATDRPGGTAIATQTKTII